LKSQYPSPAEKRVTAIDGSCVMSRRAVLRLAGTATASLLLGSTGLMASRPVRAANARPGAHIRVASLVPTAVVDPVRLTDPAGILLVNQTGEYLLNDDPHRGLVPVLAESWRPNADASVWVFSIRRGVKFHDGQLLTARDVAATFERLIDPAAGSAALSAFKGVLSKGSVKALDDYTVQFHLDAPNGNFPYYVSSDTYNAVILPANYAGHYEKTFIGTGPFRLEQYTNGGASFVRNVAYWGAPVLPERVDFAFYSDAAAVNLAMLGQQADLVVGISAQDSRLLASTPNIAITRLPSTQHDQVHMRTDEGPFRDKRVRQALALSLDRPRLVEGLLHGYGQVGNDHPFAPLYPSTDRTQAGFPNGFSTTLITEKLGDIPQFAVLLQNAAQQVGIDIRLKVEDQSLYYGDAQFGRSDWLDSTLGITDYGHRGTPNLVLSAPLVSGGAWNAAHFRNPAYDSLVKTYVSTPDLARQREAAGRIERLLLDETPLIISAYRDSLTASVANLAGLQVSAIPQLQLANAWFS
jgi:peptide/nickel transport system substrate-binding protein